MLSRLPVPSRRTVIPAVAVLAASVSYAVLVRGTPAQTARPAGVPGQRPAAAAARPETPPLSEEASRKRWEAMTAELERETKRFPGRIAVLVKDLKTGREWSHRADDLFPAASLIKVPVMVGVFEKMRRGELSLSRELVLRRRLRSGGSGTVKWRPDGARIAVRDLLDHLIKESDNTAQQMLIDQVGIGFLQRYFQDMGLVYTEIYPEGLSLAGGRVRNENFTTAREMSSLLERIYRGEMVDRFSSELMLDLLKRKKARSRLAKSLPQGWEIAHKTGLLRQACHDSAVVFSPQGDYVVTVLTGQNRNYAFAKDFIAKLGRITYSHYRGNADLYAKADGGASYAPRSR